MLPETIWRPSRLIARLTTPLVWPRSVNTSSPVWTSQSLIGPVVAGGGEASAVGKIGDGRDQAGMPLVRGGLFAGPGSQTLTSAGTGP